LPASRCGARSRSASRLWRRSALLRNACRARASSCSRRRELLCLTTGQSEDGLKALLTTLAFMCSCGCLSRTQHSPALSRVSYYGSPQQTRTSPQRARATRPIATARKCTMRRLQCEESVMGKLELGHIPVHAMCIHPSQAGHAHLQGQVT